MAAAAPTRDPITCHVLDTTTGRPGANIAVEMVCIDEKPEAVYSATTNQDGRIANWTVISGGEQIDPSGVMAQAIRENVAEEDMPTCPKGSSLWKIKFDTGAYFGLEKTFFPVVELTFLVKEGEHFHVPLLLGPYSFTTYRGS